MRPKEIIEFSTDDENMVTIDEIFKDDPKMLAELAELRKSMDEHPDRFEYPKEKKTQGQRKIKQQLEDVRRDKRFAKKLEKITAAKSPYPVRELHILHAKYRWFLGELQAFREKYLFKDPAYKLKKALCRKFGIDPILFDRLLAASRAGRLEGWDFSDASSADMCIIEMQEDDDRPEDIHNFHLNSVDAIGRHVYPVKLVIHRFASKRDVLDFIDKNWEQISPYLKEKRIRQRKTPRDVVDFIWKHRAKKAKGIVPLLKQTFPKAHLLYFDINKILNEEKHRRGVQ